MKECADIDQIKDSLLDRFYTQKASFLKSDPETLQERRAHLQKLKAMLVNHREEIFSALSKDYGNRSWHESIIAEYIAVIDDICAARKQLKKWMKPQRRKVDHLMYLGAKNTVIPQPLGVIGVIVPWNFPINQIFTQLVSIFSAGNRAMVKMSENSIALSVLLENLAERYFPAEKLSFHRDMGCVGVAFSQLPFDHLIFTGSTETAKKVMAAAASNLTPLTLELGGKCPAIIDPKYPLQKAIDRIMFVKQFNSGQICTSVDYVFVHGSQLELFVQGVQEWVEDHVPDINSKDYTSIIDDASFNRIQETLDDARRKGGVVINLTGQEANPDRRKLPLTLVHSTTEDMIVRNREIFGPVLMVLTYTEPQEVMEYVNSKPCPLALYPFTNNRKLSDLYVSRIMSGGVTINDALFHVGQYDLPFGGVGASGMGHYHGYEGFLNFSKLRPVMYQAPFTSGKFMAPPYSSGVTDGILKLLVKLKS